MGLFTFTYSYDAPGTLGELSFLDISLSSVWMLITVFALFLYRSTRKEEEYKYFIPFFFFKIILVFAFISLYVFYYGGGDGIAYWSGANSLVDLSLSDFGAFLKEVFGNNENIGFSNEFIAHGIRYPGWIFKEPEGYFVSKTAWFFNFISGKNLILTSLYFTLFSFLAQWRFYRFLMTSFLKERTSKFSILFLFLPSVAFWCSGVAKDTLVLIGILGLSRFLLKWFVLKERKTLNLLWMIFYAWLLIKTRNITFIITMGSFVLMYLFTLANIVENKALRFSLRTVIFIIGLAGIAGGLIFTGANEVLNNYLNDAAVIQQDFANNALYTGAKYNIGINDFSISSLIIASPLAIITGVLRPFLWEALSPTLLLNGIEGLVLFYLFWKKIVLKWRSYFSQLMKNKLVLFSLVFVILFAFSTGLTSVLFGVLVRLRAPLLLFFVIVLYWKDFRVLNSESKATD